ncbi:hypothetical protein [Candidatus Purcelliella pentastirinorum]|uniref:hypothetical protein n=1 Tax=Candidatus Purcelliella pentastirinorum TaxID=472834 RepID=UPI002A4E25A1|nr:hypothetical protein [Candidatus Purcelliella pentastirinorum]
MNKNILIIILNIGLPDMFIPSGNKDEICCEYKLDYYGIKEQILTWLSTLFAY